MSILGTRTRNGVTHVRPAGGAPNAAPREDPGLKKLIVQQSITFGSNRLTGANGLFTNFAVGDQIETYDMSGGKPGYCMVTGIDTVNQAYLVVDPPPVAGTWTTSLRAI